MAKIAFIGAGSIGFSKKLMKDIFSFSSLKGSTLYLMDIDERRLDIIKKLASKLIQQENMDATVVATTDRREALKNADYIVTMIQAGGLEAYEKDIEIPLRYGVNQAVGDSLGPGGIFRFLRTAKVYKSIVEDMEELCPDAYWLNYVNPMAMNTWYISKLGIKRSIGLCHSVQHTSEWLASIIGADYSDVSYLCAGINHMAFFLDFKYKGKDVYPDIKVAVEKSQNYNVEPSRIELFRKFGYFVTESSYHLSEYLPYFRKRQEWMEEINGSNSWLKEDGGYYLQHCKSIEKNFFADMEEILSSDKIEVTRTNEYCSYILNSIETGTPYIVNGNVPNYGLISNLQDDCIVEVPCLIDRNGIQPVKVGSLPLQLAALNRTNINVQELAVEGALKYSKEAVFYAVALDPHTSSILTLDEIKKMTDEMFEAEKQWLPEMK